jgi:hypothetical protein
MEIDEIYYSPELLRIIILHKIYQSEVTCNSTRSGEVID